MPIKNNNNQLNYLSARDACELRKTHAMVQFRTVYGIIEDAERKIHMAASEGAFDMLYTIPVYMPNLPIYNAAELRPYVIDHFRQQEYKVLPVNVHGIPPTSFYLNWAKPVPRPLPQLPVINTQTRRKKK